MTIGDINYNHGNRILVLTCDSCDKDLGRITFIKQESTFNPFDLCILCTKCMGLHYRYYKRGY